MHSVVRHGESSIADNGAAENYVGGCEEVFIIDKTGLFWKKIPNTTFIMKRGEGVARS
jgi:hypothetical protein